jgi:hypothetical protein
MGFSVREHEARIFDTGNKRFTGTCMHHIGRSVAGILENPDQTANRHIKIRSIETCQNEILAAFESETKTNWTVNHVNSKDVYAEGQRKLQNGERSWILDVLTMQIFGEWDGQSIGVTKEDSDNALLGIDEEDIATVIRRVLDPSQLLLD